LTLQKKSNFSAPKKAQKGLFRKKKKNQSAKKSERTRKENKTKKAQKGLFRKKTKRKGTDIGSKLCRVGLSLFRFAYPACPLCFAVRFAVRR